MSPLKIILLLNLYSSPRPFKDYPDRQRIAPAMRDAFKDFADRGLLQEGIDHALVITYENLQKALPANGVLTWKGLDLIEKLKAIQP